MKKVLFVATVIEHIKSFHLSYIDQLHEDGYLVDVAALGDISRDSVAHSFNISFSRNPLSLKNIKAYKRIKHILNDQSYEVISCHTPIASAIVRFAARKQLQTKVVYTAHGFHFFKGGNGFSQKLFKFIETISAKYTDVIVTINNEDFQAAKKFKLKPNGEVIQAKGIGAHFKSTIIKSREEVRKEFTIPDTATVLVNVAEFTKNKNQAFLINAMSNLDDSMYLILCGDGSCLEECKSLSKELNVEDRVIFTGFRKDVADIVSASDIFVFTSKREGLPVAFIEAMYYKLPVIATDVRGNRDLLDDGKGGYLFILDENAQEQYIAFVNMLYENPNMCIEMGLYNHEKAMEYSYEKVKGVFLNIYEGR